MAFVGLFSGKRIKEDTKKRKQLTRSRTAGQAKKAIIEKYGKIVDSGRYYYAGKNRGWIRYSKSRDAQRTGNVTKDKKVWARRPHKYDLDGIDTKGGYSSRGPYFGKDLSKGKYSPKINTKRNVLSILKKLYPKTQFIVLGEWGYKNVGVIWTGGPTVKALEKLDMARGLSKKRNWVLGIDIDFRRESKKKFLVSLDAFVKNKDRRASSKASTTLPLSTVKPAMAKKSKILPLSLNKKTKLKAGEHVSHNSILTIGTKKYIRVSEFSDDYIDRSLKKIDLMDVKPNMLFYDPEKKNGVYIISRIKFVERGRPPRATLEVHSISSMGGGESYSIDVELNKLPKKTVYNIVVPGKPISKYNSVNQFVKKWKAKKKPVKLGVSEKTKIKTNPKTGYQDIKKYYGMPANKEYISIWNAYAEYLNGAIGEKEFRNIAKTESRRAYNKYTTFQKTNRSASTSESQAAYHKYNHVNNIVDHRLNEIKKIKRAKRSQKI